MVASHFSSCSVSPLPSYFASPAPFPSYYASPMVLGHHNSFSLAFLGYTMKMLESWEWMAGPQLLGYPCSLPGPAHPMVDHSQMAAWWQWESRGVLEQRRSLPENQIRWNHRARDW